MGRIIKENNVEKEPMRYLPLIFPEEECFDPPMVYSVLRKVNKEIEKTYKNMTKEFSCMKSFVQSWLQVNYKGEERRRLEEGDNFLITFMRMSDSPLNKEEEDLLLRLINTLVFKTVFYYYEMPNEWGIWSYKHEK